jgi:hypothetical protein
MPTSIAIGRLYLRPRARGFRRNPVERLMRTRIVVMDEPTASLDLGNRILVLDTIRGLAESGLAIVLSTDWPEHKQRQSSFATNPTPSRTFGSTADERLN